MKIKFLGTGANEGIPAMFCRCPFCQKIRSMGAEYFRARTQVLIDGKLLVDFPPESFSNALKYGFEMSDIETLLVTHSHMDHFYAHDFVLRGYKFAHGLEKPLDVYGDEEVKEVYLECTRREMTEEVASGINFNTVLPYTEIFAGEYRVLALPANHSKTEKCLLYYIERGGKGYLHLYDTNLPEDGVYEYLKSKGAHADAVAFDCTYVTGSGNRHMGINDDMTVKQKLLNCGVADGDTEFIITHFSHNGKPYPEKLREFEKNYGVHSAYDGYEIEI